MKNIILFLLFSLLFSCRESNVYEKNILRLVGKNEVYILRKKNDHLNDSSMSDEKKFNGYKRKECKRGFWQGDWKFYKILFFRMKDGNSYISKYAYDSLPSIGPNEPYTGAVYIWEDKCRNEFMNVLINTFGEKELVDMISHPQIPKELRNGIICIKYMDKENTRRRIFFLTMKESTRFMDDHPETIILDA
jgi:hypothetical protein